MTDYCEFYDLPKDSCGHCTGRNGATSDTMFQANEIDERGPWVTARFRGPCSSCGCFIRTGDRIRADGSGGWACADCGE
ncbi:MAG: hypothetical protein JWM19_858 [Actinomycetia bacterium]|nr:hypothetical protein [Actinomycetes bacterium]